MPISYPVSTGKYRPTLADNQQFGMVSIEFDNITNRIAKYKGTFGAGPIIEEEMRAFGKEIVEPIFRMFSPYKEGGDEESLYSWAHANNHLVDSLRTEWLSGGELILRARKQAVYTIKGNGSGRITPARSKNLRIELDGGEVIYRKSVSTYQPKQPNWARQAWDYIRAHNYQVAVGQRISLRILQTLFPQNKTPLPPRPVFRASSVGSLGGRPTGAEARQILANRRYPRTRKPK